MNIKIYIVNFNTTTLTNKCIKSIAKNLHSFEYQICIFDNSTIDKFKLDDDINCNVRILDNTQGQLIDFGKVCNENVDLKFYAQTYKQDQSKHGTLKHSYTIDYIIEHEDSPFMLFDSDTELLKDIDFIDSKYATVAGICVQEPRARNRFLPFIQYFNVPMIKQNGIRYFDKNRIMFGSNPSNAFTYDTGCSFYEDVMSKKLEYKEIKYEDYVDHLCCGSWICKNNKLRDHYREAYMTIDSNSMKKYFKDHKTLFVTNGDIVPDSPLLLSISLYKDVVDDNLLCIPGKNIDNNMPIFGLRAFMLAMNEALKRGYEYILYVDADCFIWSLENLYLKFREFVDGDYIFGGVPDGGIFCHRNSNNYSINPFLAFFNMRLVSKYIENGRLMFNPMDERYISQDNKARNAQVLAECAEYRDKFQKTVPYMKTSGYLKCHTNSETLAYTHKFTTDTEYYYKLFLGLYHNVERAMYIHGRDYVCESDKLGVTSGLYINKHMEDDKNLICLHTWFSRLLMNPGCPDPVLNDRSDVNQGVCHYNRIKSMMKFIEENHQ